MATRGRHTPERAWICRSSLKTLALCLTSLPTDGPVRMETTPRWKVSKKSIYMATTSRASSAHNSNLSSMNSVMVIVVPSSHDTIINRSHGSAQACKRSSPKTLAIYPRPLQDESDRGALWIGLHLSRVISYCLGGFLKHETRGVQELPSANYICRYCLRISTLERESGQDGQRKDRKRSGQWRCV